MLRRKRGGEVARFVAPLRRAAEMQTDADRLALDQHARLVRDEGVERLLDRVNRGQPRRRVDRGAGRGEFQPVRAGDQEIGKAQIAQRRHRPAADDRQPACQRIAQPQQRRDQVVVDVDATGRIGDRRQRPVEIQEQRRALQQAQRRGGKIGCGGGGGRIKHGRKVASSPETASPLARLFPVYRPQEPRWSVQGAAQWMRCRTWKACMIRRSSRSTLACTSSWPSFHSRAS